ncbi:ABC transporter substrate-binding protein [Pseudoroseicyclus aestuarii]|uniref:Iron complex transport system substrate-binding protein n=1 Tax=Pseudoroseicyclus aestuarii TaxID=1795041 RepID=A0A318SU21_9RHOB|nr:ABC transporter substrate-binding protein [Pseudoroseicyclus aestuarii]PYE83736.1 iron complex transport system substrate-binding protein [Pseudoroseicyclus aestuarii]
MRAFTMGLAAGGIAALWAAGAAAQSAEYPLTIENCGRTVTIEAAPQNAIGLGQNSAEILLLLGLQDRMAATAFWPTNVLPELAEANAEVPLLTVEMPTLESMLATRPDFVAASLPLLLGPDSNVARRDDFEDLGIPTYVSPSACSTRQDTGDIYGSRDALWTMDQMYQEIEDLALIFGVPERGEALIADFRAREAALRDQFAKTEGLSFLFWFSSPSPADDAYLGGANGPSGYIADLMGGTNAIRSEADWPTVGWEGIMAADPTVFVVAELDRERWDLDRAETKIDFMTSDPSVSQMEAVQSGRIAVMNGAAMNPSIRTIYGAEELAAQLETIELPR